MNLREIDRLVAEKVMGWPVVDAATGAELGNPDAHVVVLGPFAKAPRGFVGLMLWRPSEDIAAAWEVVSEMRDSGWFTSTTDLTLDSGTEDWIWHFKNITHPMTEGIGRGPVPLAICLAALKAKGIEVPA